MTLIALHVPTLGRTDAGHASAVVPPAAEAPLVFECAVGGCRHPQADTRTRFCQAHADRYWDWVSEGTRHIGRGWL